MAVLDLPYFKAAPVIAAFDPTWPFPAGSLDTEAGYAPYRGRLLSVLQSI